VFSLRYLLFRHGYLFLFVYVVAVQIGVPIPADPLLLVMGALVGDHRYSFLKSLTTAVLACLTGDCLWYQFGRLKGRSVLGLLCKLTLEPDTCVRKTESMFAKRGARTLLFSKFIPGTSLLSTALAGVTKMPPWRFVLADTAGCTLWASAYLLVGLIFHHQVDEVVLWLGLFGHRAGVVAISLIALYIAFKYFQRWRFFRELRVNRITPQAARELLDSGHPVTIVDLRHPAEVEREGVKIAGAMVVRPDEVRLRSNEIPQDHDIILYCT
jgi:membrane protein DedA with SNARE-associated domain